MNKGNDSLKKRNLGYKEIENRSDQQHGTTSDRIMANTRGIFMRQRKRITGLSSIAIMIAKTNGMIISWPMYK
ncbi:MAG: hypothetical protein WDM78_17275 [Puia sp.]